MVSIRSKVCGIDVHKKILVATVLDRFGNKQTNNFTNNISGIYLLRNWIYQEKCEIVAFESTGDYWVQLYESLEPIVPIEVANAFHIKHFPGKKTDVEDSEWIAQLALNSQITPSRIFQGEQRDLRSLTRYRELLIQQRTLLKNKIHHILDASNVRLSHVLTDIFGKTGNLVINALINGTCIDEVLKHIPKNLNKRKDEIREAISCSLSQRELLMLKSSLNLINGINSEIKEIETMIDYYITANHQDKMKILLSIPGVGHTGACVLISEIGNASDFSSGEKLAAWAGIVPSVYQSAGTLRMGSITKRGNSHLRTILVEIAHACARKKGTKLWEFFERIKNHSGYKKAIVALARKLITIIWHLLINKETYADENYTQKQKTTIPEFLKMVSKIGIDEAIELIENAKKEVNNQLETGSLFKSGEGI